MEERSTGMDKLDARWRSEASARCQLLPASVPLISALRRFQPALIRTASLAERGSLIKSGASFSPEVLVQKALGRGRISGSIRA
jgi:hypothetical protein